MVYLSGENQLQDPGLVDGRLVVEPVHLGGAADIVLDAVPAHVLCDVLPVSNRGLDLVDVS